MKISDHETINFLNIFFKMSQFNAVGDKRSKITLLECIDVLNDKTILMLTGLGRRLQNKQVSTKHNRNFVPKLSVF